jgi:Putative peptidoglycan binding domain
VRLAFVCSLIICGLVLQHTGMLAQGQQSRSSQDKSKGPIDPDDPGGAQGRSGSPRASSGTTDTRINLPKSSGSMEQHIYQDQVRQVQQRLKAAGYNPGPVDGYLGPQTEEALRNYQKAHGLSETGQLDEQTREQLTSERGSDMPGRSGMGGTTGRTGSGR